MRKPLAFIDVETTGLNSQLHEIIEISIIKVCPIHGMTNYTSKIKPKRIQYAEPKALLINGYNEKEWSDAPDVDQVMSRVAQLTSGCILVGHNVRFDEDFVSETCFRNSIKTRYDRRMLDTVTLSPGVQRVFSVLAPENRCDPRNLPQVPFCLCSSL